MAVAAAYSKHRRRDEVPLHPDLIAELRPWLAVKPLEEPLWPGQWAKNNEAGDIIRRDLKIARVAWIGEARTPEEQQKRESSDFLTYRDSEGRVADFHSLRHRFITELVKAGVAPKDAKELARHSTITLTMDRYAHVGIRDTAAAVARLSLPPGVRPDSGAGLLRATGTDNASITGAAPGAAASGNGRSSLRSAENVEPSERGRASQPKALIAKAFEEERGLEETEEESTPGGTRTHTLPLRRRMLYPVELRARSCECCMLAWGRFPCHPEWRPHSEPLSSQRARTVYSGPSRPCSLLKTSTSFTVVRPPSQASNFANSGASAKPSASFLTLPRVRCGA